MPNEAAALLDEGLRHHRRAYAEYDITVVAAGYNAIHTPVGLVLRKRVVRLQDRVHLHELSLQFGTYNKDFTNTSPVIIDVAINVLDGQEPPFINERDFINYGIGYVAKYFGAEVSSALS